MVKKFVKPVCALLVASLISCGFFDSTLECIRLEPTLLESEAAEDVPPSTDGPELGDWICTHGEEAYKQYMTDRIMSSPDLKVYQPYSYKNYYYSSSLSLLLITGEYIRDTADKVAAGLGITVDDLEKVKYFIMPDGADIDGAYFTPVVWIGGDEFRLDAETENTLMYWHSGNTRSTWERASNAVIYATDYRTAYEGIL